MPAKSPSEVGNLFAHWNSTAGVASTTWTDVVSSRVLTAASSGVFPATVTHGSKTYLRFVPTKLIRTTSADASYTPVFSGNCTIVMFGRIQNGTDMISTTKVADFNASTHESALVLSRDHASTKKISVARIDGSAAISEVLGSGDRLEIPGRLSLFGLRKTGSSIEALANTAKSPGLAITNVTDADGIVVGDLFTAATGGTMDVEHLVVFSAAVSDQDMADMLRWYRPSKSPIHAGASVWLDPTQNVAATTWTDRVSGVVFTKTIGSDLAAVTVANRPMVRLENTLLDSTANVADIASHFCTCTTFVFGANRASYPSTYLVHGTSSGGGQIRGIWSGGSPNVNSVYEQQYTVALHYIQYWSGTIDYGVPHYRAVTRFSGEAGFGSFDGNVIATAIVGDTSSTAHWIRLNRGPDASDASDTDYGGVVYFPAGLRQYEIAEINDFMLDQELYADEIDGVATVTPPALSALHLLEGTVNGLASLPEPSLGLTIALIANAIDGVASLAPFPTLTVSYDLAPDAIDGTGTVTPPSLVITIGLTPDAIDGTGTVTPPGLSAEYALDPDDIAGSATVTPPGININITLVPDSIDGVATITPLPPLSISYSLDPDAIGGVASVVGALMGIVGLVPDTINGVATITPPALTGVVSLLADAIAGTSSVSGAGSIVMSFSGTVNGAGAITGTLTVDLTEALVPVGTLTISIPSDYGTGGSAIIPFTENSLVSKLTTIRSVINSNALVGAANTIGSKFVKDTADASASTDTVETAFHVTKETGTISGVSFIPSTNVTADDTNYATITLARRRAGVSAVVATLVTTTAGTGNLTAWLATTAVGLTNADISASDVLTFSIVKSGTGVVIPKGILLVEIA